MKLTIAPAAHGMRGEPPDGVGPPARKEVCNIDAGSNNVGACWLGLYPREGRVAGMRKLLKLPSSIVPFAIVSLGFPAEIKSVEDRYNPLRIHRNQW